MIRIYPLLIAFLATIFTAFAQPKNFNVIAYYAGKSSGMQTIPAEKLTHIIFSFGHLQGNRLAIDNAEDSLTIKSLVALKARNPQLKIMLSLGGWGGCGTCSEVFSTESGRKEFSESTLALSEYFNTDGIDLDWEYPAIDGFPDHKFQIADRQNFTALIKSLRAVLGTNYEISFAAGGFGNYIENSIEWEEVMKDVNRVNIMSYDLVHGYSTTTGHHTPLYSTPLQEDSSHKAIRNLIKRGVPKNKIVIGAAFYARVWEDVPSFNDGLYQTGKFKTTVNFNHFSSELTEANGFKFFWDEHAQAPYAYNKKLKLFATFDDKQSIEYKTNYVIDQKLNGIMFWELSHDLQNDGLVDTIHGIKMSTRRKK
jgi:chitinase